MSVKVIVTDMDGTFLNDAKTYNQPRFMAQYQELKKRGIKFVVASGNQYYQLISFFPELKDEISLSRKTAHWFTNMASSCSTANRPDMNRGLLLASC